MRWTTTVLSCSPSDGGYVVELAETHFHPRGGGQLADRGTIGEANVKDVVGTAHYTDAPAYGEVECEVDDLFRERMCLLHSAEHLFMGSLLKKSDVELEKIDLGEETGKVVIDGDVGWDEITAAEERVNKKIAEGLPVVVEEMEKKKVPDDVRIKKERVPERVSVVRIGDFDAAACAGTHVENTSEIVFFKVLWVNRSGSKTTVEFAAGPSALELSRNIANSALEASVALGTEPDKLEATVRNLLKERSEMEERLAKTARELSDSFDLEENCAALPLPKEELTRLFNSSDDEDLLLVSSLDGFLIARGEGRKAARELVEKLGGGCGGRDVVSGAVKELSRLKEELSDIVED